MDLPVQNNSCEWNQEMARVSRPLAFVTSKLTEQICCTFISACLWWWTFEWSALLTARKKSAIHMHMFLSWHMFTFLLVTRLTLVGSRESSDLVSCKPAIPVGKVGGFYFPLFLLSLAINCLFSRQPSLWCKMEFCCAFGLFPWWLLDLPSLPKILNIFWYLFLTDTPCSSFACLKLWSWVCFCYCVVRIPHLYSTC